MGMNIKLHLSVNIQRLLPKHFLSKLTGVLAESQKVWLKNFLILSFIKIYKIDMSEVENPNINSYKSFNEFFTRRLSEDARECDLNNLSITSPVDGSISQIGQIHKNKILQAKGINYSVERLVGCKEVAQTFNEGKFATIYLSPSNYHRVHAPCDSKLIKTCYFPGNIYSVNKKTCQIIPDLFTRNERLVCYLRSPNFGDFCLIFVGAMLVRGIETVWKQPEISTRDFPQYNIFQEKNLLFKKGEEIGCFKYGSTVILLFIPKFQWLENLASGTNLLVGERIALRD
ncbi:MAG: phosphatidylserine decarboxylase [Cellvibrionales bacterium TMED49]|nr:phosphatidylserine decarboxylase [Porticoccaceae bacterium]OUU39111.1 MAG: phosphatidylserine decarboxylase [Cellvibrionales bacterium TMED49]|tara:strand:- start:661 stop:1518 length:858 start_codon:yes stop_codon:yes gene_type:complete